MIDVESAENAYVFLLSGSGRSGEVLFEDDDGGEGTNSRIVATLSAGSYTIEATTHSEATAGTYTLRLSASGCVSSFTAGSAISGEWSAASCGSQRRSGSSAGYHSFSLTSSSEVMVDLTSSEDTYLVVRSGAGTSGAVVYEDNDGGAGTNSRVVGLLAAGTYTLEAVPYVAGTAGNYSLTVTLEPCVKSLIPAAGELTTVALWFGAWSAESCESQNRTGDDAAGSWYGDYYSITLTAESQVTIDLISAQDAYLFLLSGVGVLGSVLYADNDSGTDTHARISATLPAGSYTIEATTHPPATTGSYRLWVTVNPTTTTTTTTTSSTTTTTTTTPSTSTTSTTEGGPLAVTLSAPSHCLASEGRVVRETDASTGVVTTSRADVASVDVTYTVTGGTGPLQVALPGDPPTVVGAARTGNFTVSCARSGINLNNVGAAVDVVESGTRTINVQATDSAGATAAASTTFTIAETVASASRDGGTLTAGNTYYLGTANVGALIAVPTGLTLEFQGISEHNVAHFEDTTTGSEIILDRGTGSEVWRNIQTTSPAAQTGTGTPASDTADLFDRLAQSAQQADQDSTATKREEEWKPYEDLPYDETQVGIHPKMVRGEILNVCTEETEADFVEKIGDAINTWNEALLSRLGRDVFGPEGDLFESTDSCGSDTDVEFIDESGVPDEDKQCVRKDEDGNIIGIPKGCAYTRKADKELVPIVRGTLVVMNEWTDRIVRHELGHFLGPGDYKEGCAQIGSNSSRTQQNLSQYPDYNSSLYSYGPETGETETGCLSETATTRDWDDLSSLYHPDARIGVEVVNNASDEGSFDWVLKVGDPPNDTVGNAEYNAHKYIVLRRKQGSTDVPTLLKAVPEGDAVAVTELGNLDFVDHLELTDTEEAALGYEFILVGITQGDPQRDATKNLNNTDTAIVDLTHAVITIDEKEWTLGTPAVAYGPSDTPPPTTTTTTTTAPPTTTTTMLLPPPLPPPLPPILPPTTTTTTAPPTTTTTAPPTTTTTTAPPNYHCHGVGASRYCHIHSPTTTTTTAPPPTTTTTTAPPNYHCHGVGASRYCHTH